MIIRFPTFDGEIPRSPAHLLPETAAQLAIDCDFTRNELAGLPQNTLIRSLAAAYKSFWAYERVGAATTWFAWTNDVDVVRSPAVDDQYQRFYWSDGAGFYVSSAQNVTTSYGTPTTTNRWKVGVPRPTAAPTRTAGPFTVNGATIVGTRLFCEMTDGTRSDPIPCASYLDRVKTNETSLFYVLDPTDESSPCLKSAASSGVNTGTFSQLIPAPGGFVWDGLSERAPGTIGAVDPLQIVAFPEVKVYSDRRANPVIGYPPGTVFFFHWAEWQVTPLPGTVYLYKVATAGPAEGGEPYSYSSTVYYDIGNGWYSTDASATSPNAGGAEVSASASSGLAVEITVRKQDNSTAQILLREDPSKSYWPEEFSGYTGSVVRNTASVTVATAATGAETTTISAPSVSISVSVAAAGTSGTPLEARAYCYTYVNSWGEESAPSDPLGPFDVIPTQPVTLQYAAVVGSGYRPIAKVRFYRTATGSAGTSYLYAGETTYNGYAGTFLDDKHGDQLGESIQTVDYYPPPQDFSAIAALPNGIIAGLRGNEVWFCEPFLPYAWKPANAISLKSQGIGLIVAENALYVTTTTSPEMITGVSSDSMTSQRMTAVQAGITKFSMCNLGPMVVYASNDGIVAVRGVDASLDLSLKYWTRSDWRRMYGSKLSVMRFSLHDGRLVVWFSDGTPGFMLKLDEEAGALTRLATPIYAAAVDTLGDTLMVRPGTSGDLYAFCANTSTANTQPCTWRSRATIVPVPTNFGALQIVGTGTVTVYVSADTVVKHTQTMTISNTDRSFIRLPGGFLARRWVVTLELAQGAVVREVTLANSLSELKNV